MKPQTNHRAGRHISPSVQSVILFGAFILFAISVQAGGTLTAPDETAFNNALIGGGTVTLAFNGTLTLTNGKTISANTVIDGTGFTVTISGNNSVRPFAISSGVSL